MKNRRSRNIDVPNSFSDRNIVVAATIEREGGGSCVQKESSSSVGYKNPPLKSRFKKGQSGNPYGRPPKFRSNAKEFCAADFVNSIAAAMSTKQILVVNGKGSYEPTIEALFQMQLQKAKDGDQKSFRLIFDVLNKFLAVSEKEKQRLREAAILYREEKLQEIKKLQTVGIDFSYIIPHPDHVFIDVEGNPRIIGPKTIAEKRKWDALAEKREVLRQQAKNIETLIEKQSITEEDLKATEELQRLVKRIQYIDNIIPDFYTPKHIRLIYSRSYRNRDDSIVELNVGNLNREQRDTLALAIEKAGKDREPIIYHEFSPEELYNRSRLHK